MSTDDLRLVKRQAEQDYPQIGCYGLIDDPKRYGSESNDFTQFATCLLWLRRCRRSCMYGPTTSYILKHVVEADSGRYITNGALIQAAVASGVRYRPAYEGSPNAVFDIEIPKITDGKTWPLLADEPMNVVRSFTPQSRRPVRRHVERALVTPSVRARILERDGFRCRRCGNTPINARLVVDHVVPIALGGKSTEGNLQTLCEPCNVGKGARPPHPHDFLS